MTQTLPEGYLLHWYEIVSVIGRGGFGITYLARDKNLDMLVAIKEYLPEDFANRINDSTVQPKTGQQAELYSWGLERFVAEARILAKFNHPNIVRVLSVFEQNKTAYMVMEYAQGEDLSTLYKNRRRENRPLDEQAYLDIFIPVCDGLSLVHNEGFIHRDIKPANIYICNSTLPLLLDFGSARQSLEHKTKALTSLVTVGYAPFEQYQQGTGKQGPWTDIYSLGASIYVGVTGFKPEDALARGGSILETGKDTYKPLSHIAAGQFSDHFLLAVDHALMFKAEHRPQHILRWADMLLGRVAVPPLPKELFVSAEISELEQTIVMPRERLTGNSKPPTTAPSRGTQGLVNASGKRLSETNQDDRQPRWVVAQPGDSIKNHILQARQLLAALPRKTVFIAAASLMLIIVVAIIIAMLSETEQMVKSPMPDTSIRQQQTPSSIDNLLTKARDAHNAQRYTQPKGNSAYDYFQSVLAIDATNNEAKAGLRDIQQQLFHQAQSHADSGDAVSALKSLDELLTINPADIAGKELKTKLISSQKTQQQIRDLLANAETSYNQKNLISPDQASAYYFYTEVLKLDVDNSIANSGLKNIHKTLLTHAQAEYKAGQLKQALQYLDDLKLVGLTTAESDTLRNQIANKQDSLKPIESLLSQAQIHLNNNRYTSPANNNAYDSYTQVLKIDQSNKAAISGIDTIKNAYKAQFDKYINNQDLKNAAYALQVMKKIAPESQVTQSMENTLLQSQKNLTSKSDIELVGDLIGEYKLALETKDLTRLRKISQFRPGREQFIRSVFQQYKDFNVNISGFEFISKERRGKATVELSKMTDKNNQVVMPGGWSKFEIGTIRDNNGRFYIDW
jgi:serine/threonine protein kinase